MIGIGRMMRETIEDKVCETAIMVQAKQHLLTLIREGRGREMLYSIFYHLSRHRISMLFLRRWAHFKGPPHARRSRPRVIAKTVSSTKASPSPSRHTVRPSATPSLSTTRRLTSPTDGSSLLTPMRKGGIGESAFPGPRACIIEREVACFE